jgi:glyoxylase-like metal-dependent hydrolase (beta-lactamase superfamily II)
MTKLHFLNCFTCNARVPSSWHTGTLCILVETRQGLALIDTGLGTQDYKHPPGILRTFQVITKVPLDTNETAVQQLSLLGYKPEDLKDIILTHMHFDHCGGISDFPDATIHVNQVEYEAFIGRPKQFTDLAYVHRHVAHQPKLTLYSNLVETWFGLPAFQLPFTPEIWLIPLYGHTRGHCGVAILTDDGWLFHVADAAPIGLEDYAPAWLVRSVLGPLTDDLRAFAAEHPEIRITTGHMWLDFFDDKNIPRL